MFCIDYVRFPVKQVLNYPIAILDWATWTNVTQIAVILEMTKNINSIPSSILVNLINKSAESSHIWYSNLEISQ